MDYQRYADENHLLVEIKDRVAVVTMNRPEKRNAVNAALHHGLETVWRDLGTDPDVGAIVLTGAGPAFCAGGDMKDFGPSGGMLILRGAKWLVQAMVNCEAPLIAAINGPAAGLGASVALLCDTTFMADTARIGDTHVNMGLVAGDGGCVIWPLLVGPHRAKEYLMSGKYVWGPEAERIGLVNHCVPADKLMDEAMAFATELANGGQCGGAVDQDEHQPDALAKREPRAGDEPRRRGAHLRQPRPTGGQRRLPREAYAHLRVELACAVVGSGYLLAEAIRQPWG